MDGRTDGCTFETGFIICYCVFVLVCARSDQQIRTTSCYATFHHVQWSDAEDWVSGDMRWSSFRL